MARLRTKSDMGEGTAVEAGFLFSWLQTVGEMNIFLAEILNIYLYLFNAQIDHCKRHQNRARFIINKV